VDCVDAVIGAEWALLLVRIMSGYGTTAHGAKQTSAPSAQRRPCLQHYRDRGGWLVA